MGSQKEVEERTKNILNLIKSYPNGIKISKINQDLLISLKKINVSLKKLREEGTVILVGHKYKINPNLSPFNEDDIINSFKEITPNIRIARTSPRLYISGEHAVVAGDRVGFIRSIRDLKVYLGVDFNMNIHTVTVQKIDILDKIGKPKKNVKVSFYEVYEESASNFKLFFDTIFKKKPEADLKKKFGDHYNIDDIERAGKFLDNYGFDLYLKTQCPIGSGLGGSACFWVSLCTIILDACGMIKSKKINKYEQKLIFIISLMMEMLHTQSLLEEGSSKAKDFLRMKYMGGGACVISPLSGNLKEKAWFFEFGELMKKIPGTKKPTNKQIMDQLLSEEMKNAEIFQIPDVLEEIEIKKSFCDALRVTIIDSNEQKDTPTVLKKVTQFLKVKVKNGDANGKSIFVKKLDDKEKDETLFDFLNEIKTEFRNKGIYNKIGRITKYVKHMMIETESESDNGQEKINDVYYKTVLSLLQLNHSFLSCLDIIPARMSQLIYLIKNKYPDSAVKLVGSGDGGCIALFSQAYMPEETFNKVIKSLGEDDLPYILANMNFLEDVPGIKLFRP